MSTPPLTEQHGCSCSAEAPKASVAFLPIAPQTVARTRFSPPTPVRNQCQTVAEAMATFDDLMAKGTPVNMVAIAGPGDPLASPDITLEAARLARERYPELLIGLKTLGLGSDKLAGVLARAGVSYVEVQVDGVKAEILEKIYAWIRPGLKTQKVSEAVELLIREQRNGVAALKFHNIQVTILTTLYPNLNITHVPRIGEAMQVLGADGMALIPYLPEAGAEVDLACPSPQEVQTATDKARKYLPIVAPLLARKQGETLGKAATQTPMATAQRPNVAVVSSNGIDIDLHLGQAIRLLVYGPRADGLTCLLETRDAPEPGTGPDRWGSLAAVLHDCFAVLAASAGETPRKVLAETGIKVLIAEDKIKGRIDALYGGGKKGKKGKN